MLKVGPVQRKVLALFLGGIGLGFSGSPTQYFHLLKAMRREWQRINQQSFTRSLRSLCQDKLLEEHRQSDGAIVLRLTELGRRYAKYHSLFGGKIKIKRPKKWDKNWRMVSFDIPEKHRRFRDILRDHLKEIGFKEFQQSVFVYPYSCEIELACLIELYDASRYVRVITAQKIDNQKELERKFSLKT